MNTAKFVKLKERIEQLQRERDRSQGQLEEKMRTLEEKFGCTTIGQAKRLLKKLTESIQEDEAKLRTEVPAWEKEFKDALQ